MKNKPHNLLLHPLFLLSLFLLLLNDFYLKYEYHNDITGKLSDFTGLFTFFIFLRVLFPSHRKTILILVTLFFLFWKSSLSTPFITLINTLHIPVQRVVDYSDYIALMILPLGYFIQPLHYPVSLLRKVAVGGIGLVSFFAFTATSLPQRITDNNRVQLNKRVKTKKTEAAVLDAFDRNGLTYKPDSAFDHTWSYSVPYLRTENDSGKVIYQKLDRFDIYHKVEGSVYKIEKLVLPKDTIYDLEIAIQDPYQGKNVIDLRSFKHRNLPQTGQYNSRAYYLFKALKKPIKKRMKEILKSQ